MSDDADDRAPEARPGVNGPFRADAQDHFVTFVYPFRHPLETLQPERERAGEEQDLARLVSLIGPSGRWTTWLERARAQDAAHAVRNPSAEHAASLGLEGAFDDSYFFLPHARDTLFPEFGKLESLGEAGAQAVPYTNEAGAKLAERATAWRAAADARPAALAKDLSHAGFVRLTLRPEHLKPVARWTLDGIPFRTAWVDLLLFPFRVGQLVICGWVEPQPAPDAVPDTFAEVGVAHPAPLADVEAFVRRAHLVHPRFLSDEMAPLQIDGVEADVRRYVEFLLQEITAQSNEPLVDEWPAFLLSRRGTAALGGDSTAYTLSSDGQVYGASLFTYVWVRAKDAAADGGDLGETGWTGTDALPTAVDQFMIEMVMRMQTGDARPEQASRGNQLDNAWVDRMRSQRGFQRYANWRALMHERAFVAVSTGGDAFCESWDFGVPKNLYHDYLMVFLYQVFVQQGLERFANEVHSRDAVDQKDKHSWIEFIRNLAARYTRFRRLHWFSAMTNRDQGEALRRMIADALNSPQLFETLEDVVEDASNVMEFRAQRSQTEVLAFLTFVFAPLATIIAAVTLVENPWAQWTAIGLAVLLLTVGARPVWRFVIRHLRRWYAGVAGITAEDPD